MNILYYIFILGALKLKFSVIILFEHTQFIYSLFIANILFYVSHIRHDGVSW